jgi:thioesterase domain-containing protein
MYVKLARAVVRPRATAAALRRQLRILGSGRGIRGSGRWTFDASGAKAVGSRYVPRSNGITIDLFVSERDQISEGRSLGWSQSHSDVLRIHTLPGTHRVLLDPRGALALADAIRASLDRVRVTSVTPASLGRSLGALGDQQRGVEHVI